jgi:hypothetical protein
MSSIVGIDFDNTLISYDEVFFNHALDLKLISPESNRNKKDVRDAIRLLPDGEVVWQKVQAFVYGKGIAQARLNEGARDFIRECIQKNIKVYVVSHKTEFSNFDKDKVNLRDAALDWMTAQHFFEINGLGLNRNQVYFESTRLEKINRMKVLGCTHFIDDLQEVFLEEGFPNNVKKILYAPADQKLVAKDLIILDSWKRIHEHFFN